MATAITSDLYGGAVLAARRTLRVQKAPTPPAQREFGQAAVLQETRPINAVALATPTPSRVIRASEASLSGDTVPASVHAAEQNAVDAYNTGITMHNNGSRLARATETNMSANGKVLDRIETDPYTGKRVAYYRKLPPDGNTDRRLPKETMQHVNRRLVAINGYDPTRPARQRREVLRTDFQPDKTMSDAVMYHRRMGELQERVERTTELNMRGERPQWHRESRRAFGFVGHHNMMRVVPSLPPTMRADTSGHTGPVTGPAADTYRRGALRSRRRRPPVEINTRTQPKTGLVGDGPMKGMSDSVGTHREGTGGAIMTGHGAPVTGSAMPPMPGMANRIDTHREGTSGPVGSGHAAPVTGSAMPPMPGMANRIETHREGTSGPVGSGHAAPRTGHAMPPVPGMANRIDTHREGTSGPVGSGHAAPATGSALPPMPGMGDRIETRREGTSGPVESGHAAPVSGNALPPMIPSNMDHAAPLREGVAGPAPSGFGSITGFVLANPAISTNLERDAPHREGTDASAFINPASAAGSGGLVTQGALRAATRRRVDETSAEAGARARGPRGDNIGFATEADVTHVFRGNNLEGQTTAGFFGPGGADVGVMQERGEFESLRNSNRAQYSGARPGVTQSHGGGIGSGYGGTGIVNRERFGSRTTNDRTVVRSIRAEMGPRAALYN